MCLAVPGQIRSVEGTELFRTGTIDFNGIQREVSLAFVPSAQVGDWILVHAGVALRQIDDTQAAVIRSEWARLDGEIL